jgi:solute carrier family 25 (mitochondrial dicarboxylate transporter), member 10
LQQETVRVGNLEQLVNKWLMHSAGVVSLWSGVSASILRQATYSTARFGLYNVLAKQAAQKWNGGNKLSTAMTIACAGVAGGMAGMIGNPVEVDSFRCATRNLKTHSRLHLV